MDVVKSHYQNLIIGFGKGGKTLASWLSSEGQEVAIVEQSPAMYGGSCINIACIPSKSLIVNAEIGVPYSEAHAIKDKLISSLRKKNYDKIAKSAHGIVIDGKASFLDSNSIKVITASGELKISADRIFINTGTRPATPKIPGADGPRIYDSTTLMELAEKPARLIIVGGGFVGLEFAVMFLKYGSKVMLIDHEKEFLPHEDRDIAEAIQNDLTAMRLEVISEADVHHFSSAANGTTVTVHYTKDGADASVTGDGVLLATGRSPVTEDLNLPSAGVHTDDRGYVKVNEQLQTTAANIWAIGDVNGGPQFTYISLDDFRVVKNQLSGGAYNSLQKRKMYATSLFISPSYSKIGLNEQQAKEKGLDYTVFKLPAAAIPKTAILRQQEGLLKAIVDNSTGKILGCMLYCAQAHEIINIIQLAMHADVSFETLRDNIYTHPTMAEAFNDLFAKPQSVSE